MTTVETTRCPSCGRELPTEASHKLHGRYLCQDGSSAGGSHRFVIITNAMVEIAEADDVEDATQAAAYLTGEQGRQLFAVEASVLADRRDRLAALRAKRDRIIEGASIAQGMDPRRSWSEPIVRQGAGPEIRGWLDCLDEMIQEAEVWTA